MRTWEYSPSARGVAFVLSLALLNLVQPANALAQVNISGVAFSGGTITDPLLLPSGSATAPSWGFAADNDGTGTGVFRSAANQLSITNNGAEKYRFGATGTLSVLDNTGAFRLGAGADITFGRRAAGQPVTNAGGATYATTAGSSVTVGGVFCVNTTSQATTGTVEEILATCTIPANTLSIDGTGLRVKTWGTFAANGNSKTLNIRFGGIGGTIVGNWTSTGNATAWSVESVIVRTGAATQVAYGNGFGFNLAPRTQTASPSQTLSGAVDLVVTGTTATASGDATFLGLIVEVFN